MSVEMRLGSRGSPLALTQTRLVRGLLAHEAGLDEAEAEIAFPITSFTTTGDQIQDRKLQEAGGKGLFTKELDEALLDGRIDAAVHSMKDLPTRLPEGLILAAVPAREDPRDAFISRRARTPADLPEGAVVGTASLRRQAQLLHMRPDLKVAMLRGSVGTRLKRLDAGEMDATFLALAGLTRLGLAHEATSHVPVELMPPAVAQGALALVCRADDAKTLAALRALGIEAAEIAVAAERGLLDALDGSCRTPIGALGQVEAGRLTLIAEVLTPDGARRWRREAAVALGADPRADADALGRQVGLALREEAGDAYQSVLAHAPGW